MKPGRAFADGNVEAAGVITINVRPFAVICVMPPLGTSYLIVRTSCSSPTLYILSFPDRRLIHMHTLEGIWMWRVFLPTQTALCDFASKAVHVLP